MYHITQIETYNRCDESQERQSREASRCLPDGAIETAPALFHRLAGIRQLHQQAHPPRRGIRRNVPLKYWNPGWLSGKALTLLSTVPRFGSWRRLGLSSSDFYSGRLSPLSNRVPGSFLRVKTARALCSPHTPLLVALAPNMEPYLHLAFGPHRACVHRDTVSPRRCVVHHHWEYVVRSPQLPPAASPAQLHSSASQPSRGRVPTHSSGRPGTGPDGPQCLQMLPGAGETRSALKTRFNDWKIEYSNVSFIFWY
ncbi:Protein of unknown function [Gryllus bimaculatus]|nr:Protein of unknown function [Gryllus bimaculatus]